ncbi:hypothetical protein BDS110ZK4_28240 [Bradyrhizobium diazoefficiens]|uniref:Uncharacterized protein n=2 Tax=Bradyrhizobium TaxID=374 RepID=A0A809Z7C7_9BRAD|nr:hypothetical protein XF1B_47700 [Bradyrhizobium diazoefficiens]BCE48354.1 hypothetical protein XF4B_47030 [Bradyrhizobium diazoefficiens]BCE91870.1 hypothetical protein XF10B_46680 [Bradyrhizobium diazoefficiens]BCF26798.1 hypothetical protein XF14B_47500 [Bradyrhizobium diazoefficiens]
MGKKQTRTVEPAVRPQPINARFQSRLHGMLEEICQQMLIIEPAMDKVAIPIKEFIDFLDFEIEKVTLSINQEKWESIVNVQKVANDEAWLKRLTELRNGLDIYDLTASVPRIDALVAAIEKTFDVEGGG